jgi:hypothetical protein
LANLLGSLTNLIKSLNDDEPKPPLHVGEVMSCWTYSAALAEAVTFEQICLNTTTDPELREFIEKTMEGASSQQRRLADFLQNEGIPLPPVSEPKPLSEPSAIPLGAKLTDNEISNAIGIKLAASVVTCATGAAECIRNDVGVMFIKFQEEAMTYGMMLKTLMKKKGWIKTPPYYNPPGLPSQ